MNRPKDICYKCEKADDHMTMTYVNEENKHDDRLICDDCDDKNIYRIYIECSGGLRPLITEHDFDDYYHSDYFVRKAIDSFWYSMGKLSDKYKYKLEDDKKMEE